MPWYPRFHNARVGIQPPASVAGDPQSMPRKYPSSVMMLSGSFNHNQPPDMPPQSVTLLSYTNMMACVNACKDDPSFISVQRNKLIKILGIILIPFCVLICLTGNSFGVTVNNYLHSTKIRSTLLFSLDLAYMIRYLQRERDGSALYLSSIRPETKGFLLERYQDTDKAIQTLPDWPMSLTKSRPELTSRETFLRTLNKHRYELNSRNMTYHHELITYSDWIEIFIKWFYKSITEARSEKIWKEFVAYQELLVASEYLGRERAMGIIFYTLGEFPTREEYLYFVESQDTSNSSFAAARQYSAIAKKIYDTKIKDNPDLMNTILMKRAEIRSRNSGAVTNTEGSLEQAKFWFENMTYFQDIIKEAQVQLALTIDGIMANRQQMDLTNIIIICVIFSVVLILCPIIIYTVYNLTAEIQRCSIVIDDRINALSEEKKLTDELLHRMVPKSIADSLNQNEMVAAKEYDQATVMFADIFGFSEIYSRSSPKQIMEMLNTVYSCLDTIIQQYDAYTVDIVRDSYLVVAGVPTSNGKKHAAEIANLSLAIIDRVSSLEIPHIPEMCVQFRIGCHSGSVVAGVTGTKVPHYSIFGETVNIASAIERLGLPNRIHLSESTANILQDVGGFIVHERENFMENVDPALMHVFNGPVKGFWLAGLEGTEGTAIKDPTVPSNHVETDTDTD